MKNVVLIPGDGIGIEITAAVKTILETAGAPINWIECEAGLGAYRKLGNPLPDETVAAIEEHRIALKGPLTTPVGTGFRSINVALRQKFNLFSNIRPAITLPNVDTPFKSVDMVIFRENTQGLYIGKEHWIDENKHAESIAVVTEEASRKIITAAFEYARTKEKEKVTLVHKANILKLTTGLFLEVGRTVAKDFPDIEFQDLIVDNMAMQMVMRPEQFDVVVTTNLFGDILSDLASGLVGGLGVTGSANIGDDAAMFEAVHGSAPDIAGQNKANPIALLFSSLMMLEHLDEKPIAENIRKAIYKTLVEKKAKCTMDIGGKGTTDSFTEAVCSNL
ncbi:MAG: isocitrate/isopropylmalate dehydrogenase family protein [Balneola sp.]|nr:isocitrate/isopropylmalate dehydrogenase family protein [Balneola sp.]MBO6649998.1 isocitrate/isopropylmalate dehydrogenase family protein [Balneola sp.]MBO6711652.1 isocitrate/isopropylmalate dehydrogenase family protein [Balneola sp.]MBO6799848.1 isocitrate/isopropylmalate dehydrogenase family protein [Balneola sp.]MBO6871091.1 isocitrate/isopropylmalate dehydrogenase family protein [Balneola sp.]